MPLILNGDFRPAACAQFKNDDVDEYDETNDCNEDKDKDNSEDNNNHDKDHQDDNHVLIN